MTRPRHAPNVVLAMALALAFVTVAACSMSGGSATPSGGSSPGADATVDGRTFLSTAVQGAVLVPGSRIRLGFLHGNLDASGGCNAMGGPYTIGGGRLATARMISTDMGCDAPRMRQDQWLAQLLTDAALTLSGDTLTLQAGSVTLTLLDRRVASPDLPIVGTPWALDGIVAGQTASSVPAGVTASLHIVDGQVTIETGCNTATGPVEVTDATLTFGTLVRTKRACVGAATAVERAIVGALDGRVSYTIDADALTLAAGPNGSAGLTFRGTR